MIDVSLNKLMTYCQAHTTPQSQILYELERETHLKTLAPQMLSGPVQGQLLRFISLMLRPKTALEIGTFTGYAAICIAEGLPDEGVLHTIEANPEMEYLIRKYIGKAGLEDKIQLHIGKAENIIPQLPTTFDLVFMDAGKKNYKAHYDLVFDLVNPGGLIIADNVLWSGKVVLEETDADTLAIQAFNTMIQEDERVENILLPLRDGLFIVRKLR
jgi:predicted O-methyltransferase YrrM